jgi:ferrous iron transport protein B
VANYAGVTIERKEGAFTTGAGNGFRVLDLPGAYSLSAHTPDEEITRDVVAGLRKGEAAPDVVVCVVNATNLRLNLRLVLEIKRLGLPMMLALNMVDVARSAASPSTRAPVAGTGHAGGGNRGGAGWRREVAAARAGRLWPVPASQPNALSAIDAVGVEETQREVRRILAGGQQPASTDDSLSEKIDNVVLHPVLGPIILAVLMFLVFQAVFSWATCRWT